MRRFLLHVSIRLIIVLALLIGAVRVIGGFIPNTAEEMLRQFECEPQPCWHDVHPGDTSLAEARNVLSEDETIRIVVYDLAADYLCWAWTNDWHNPNSEWDACYFPSPNSSAALQLTYANQLPLRLGDVLPLMRKPIISDLMCAPMPRGIVFSENMGILVFEHTLLNRVVPELSVSSITYFAPEANIISPQKGTTLVRLYRVGKRGK